MMLGKYIYSLRQEQGYSQQYVADFLDLSRPTYSALEKDETELTISQAKKLASLYGLPVSDLIEAKKRKIELGNSSQDQEPEKDYLRVSIPQEKVEIFKQVLLYVLDKVGAKSNLGETVLYKLLYFIDFDYYELYEKQLIGATYIKNHHGPTPITFKKLSQQMIEAEQLEALDSSYFEYPQKRYLPLVKPNLELLSAQQVKFIDAQLERLADLNAAEISSLSHQDAPWLAAQSGKVLDYEAVFYRTPVTSRRNYDSDL